MLFFIRAHPRLTFVFPKTYRLDFVN